MVAIDDIRAAAHIGHWAGAPGALRTAAASRYDVCVVGGGINGLAIARDAALRGLDVILLERRDIGSGTSAWSSRLIHGGLKYLEHVDVKLVRESVAERRELLRGAAHLVHPYPMLLPFFRHNARSRHLVRAGLAVHDLLSLGDPLPNSRSLRAGQVARYVPGLSRDGLESAALYHDAQVPWAERLCVEQALDARAHGARVLTRTSVEGLATAGGRVVGVEAREVTTGETATIHARVTVNAAGPWVDQVLSGTASPRLIGGTKGSHLVVDPFPSAPRTCVFYEARSDGRPILVLPWAGRYLIGSTDLHFDGDLDAVSASDEEIRYLLDETNRLLPDARLTDRDVLYSYAGVRPLPYSPDAQDTGSISRGHRIVDHAPEHPGLLSIVGGKLTTHRALGEDAVDTALEQLDVGPRPCRTRDRPLPGAVNAPAADVLVRRLAGHTTLTPEQLGRLVGLYGVRTEQIVDLVRSFPDLGASFDEETQAVTAEIVLAAEAEGATTISDILFRRTMVGLNAEVGLTAASAVAQVATDVLGWSDERVASDLRGFATERDRFRPRVPTPATVSAAEDES